MPKDIQQNKAITLDGCCKFDLANTNEELYQMKSSPDGLTIKSKDHSDMDFEKEMWRDSFAKRRCEKQHAELYQTEESAIQSTLKANFDSEYSQINFSNIKEKYSLDQTNHKGDYFVKEDYNSDIITNCNSIKKDYQIYEEKNGNDFGIVSETSENSYFSLEFEKKQASFNQCLSNCETIKQSKKIFDFDNTFQNSKNELSKGVCNFKTVKALANRSNRSAVSKFNQKKIIKNLNFIDPYDSIMLENEYISKKMKSPKLRDEAPIKPKRRYQESEIETPRYEQCSGRHRYCDNFEVSKTNSIIFENDTIIYDRPFINELNNLKTKEKDLAISNERNKMFEYSYDECVNLPKSKEYREIDFEYSYDYFKSFGCSNNNCENMNFDFRSAEYLAHDKLRCIDGFKSFDDLDLVHQNLKESRKFNFSKTCNSSSASNLNSMNSSFQFRKSETKDVFPELSNLYHTLPDSFKLEVNIKSPEISRFGLDDFTNRHMYTPPIENPLHILDHLQLYESSCTMEHCSLMNNQHNFNSDSTLGSFISDPKCSLLIFTAIIVKLIDKKFNCVEPVKNEVVSFFKSVSRFSSKTLLLGYLFLMKFSIKTQFKQLQNLLDMYLTCCIVASKSQDDKPLYNGKIMKLHQLKFDINYLEGILLNALSYNLKFENHEIENVVLDIQGIYLMKSFEKIHN